MLITSRDRVLVQGITGRQGTFWTARMRASGTTIVAGSSPGKGGREVDGIPVYDCARDAARAHPLDASVLLVPPLSALPAALDAIAAGARKIVLLAEHIPYQDTMRILAAADDAGARVLGPNTAGLVVPGEAAVGIMPGTAANIFRPGHIGVISRSGSLGTLVCLHLVSAGYGQSAFIGIGGDPILGTTTLDALRTLDQDPRTSAIVLVGEIGGAMEEEAAGYIAGMSKPVVAFIAGASAPSNTRMGHAGAIVTGTRGSAHSKTTALATAGATVVDLPSHIGAALHTTPHAAGIHADTAATPKPT